MCAAHRTTSDACRVSIGLGRRPRCFLVAVVLCPALAVAGDLADDEPDKNAPLTERQVQIADAMVYGWVFGTNPFDEVGPRTHLERALRQKIAVIDRVCRLTGVQKEKLELAGRGDIKRLINRAGETATQFQLCKHDRDKVKALIEESHLLGRSLASWISGEDGLFPKTLGKTLTEEQAASYKPLRAVYRTGGVVQTRQAGPEEVLEINLTGTAVTDDSLAAVSRLPGLYGLFLGNTQVTDAALVQLKGANSLQELWLFNTQVTDAGVADLQRAIPGLTVRNGGAFARSLTITIVSDANGEVASMTVGLAKLFDGPLDENRLRQLDHRLKDVFAIEGAFDGVLLRVGKTLDFGELMKVIELCTRQKMADGGLLTRFSLVELSAK